MNSKSFLKNALAVCALATGCFAMAATAGAEADVIAVEYVYYDNGTMAYTSYSTESGAGYVMKDYILTSQLQFVLNPTGGNTTLSDSEIINAWLNGMSEWNSHLVNNMFSMSYSIDPTATKGAKSDSVSTISFGDLESGVLAKTTSYIKRFNDGASHPASYYTFESDIVFNTDVEWTDVSKTGSGRDIESIATHELGHTLGLGDVYDANYSYVTMYGMGMLNDIGPRTLETPDLYALSKYYSVYDYSATATPTSEPTPVPTLTPVPTEMSTEVPTAEPTLVPTTEPTLVPTGVPTSAPTTAPTMAPTAAPVYGTIVIPASKLNMRSEASSTSAIVTTIPNGGQVTVLEQGNGWLKIVYNGYTGYVMSQYVVINAAVPTANPTLEPSREPAQTPASSPSATAVPTAAPSAEPAVKTATVTTSGTGLNMRSAASASSAKVTTIPYHATVTVLEYGSTWSRVSYNGYTGYVMNMYITLNGTAAPTTAPTGTASATAAPTPSTDTRTATVNTSGTNLNMRSTASASSSKITTIPYRATVTVIEYGSTWSRVSYNGYTGYVMSQYIKLNGTEASTPVPTPDQTTSGDTVYATVATSGGSLNMRAAASTSSGKVTTMPNGVRVTVLEKGATWSRISYNGYTGYAMSSYLRF